MLSAPFQNALVLTGPTASGKTKLALELAIRLDAEIISMDSMALYRSMDIGTAKPTLSERSLIRHHLVDVLAPWESASVAWWLEEARRCARDIESRSKRVLFVGGTPLYLKALIFGLFDGPSADISVRSRLIQEAREQGSAALHQRLSQVDPVVAARVHVNDERRIIRALEVFEITGRPISAWQQQWDEPARNLSGSSAPCVLWLEVPRAELHRRINRRVEAMFAAGLVEEVKSLMKLNKPLSKEAQQALGYKETLDHLRGAISLEETIVRVQARTRQFAKRQITWFRHLPGCTPATTELTQRLWHHKMNA